MINLRAQLLIGLTILLLPTLSLSQSDAKKSTKPASTSSNVLDFEADVIEGERTAPSILIQMDLQSPNLDTLVFQRKNFNDFHLIDMRRKPKFRGIKGQ
jgi:hypothetical protein